MKIASTTFLFFIALCWPLSSMGQIYKWVDENGKTHYSDKPAPEGNRSNAKEFKVKPSNIFKSDEALSGNTKLILQQQRLKRERAKRKTEQQKLAKQNKAARERRKLDVLNNREEAEALRRKKLAALRGKNRRRKGK